MYIRAITIKHTCSSYLVFDKAEEGVVEGLELFRFPHQGKALAVSTAQRPPHVHCTQVSSLVTCVSKQQAEASPAACADCRLICCTTMQDQGQLIMCMHAMHNKAYGLLRMQVQQQEVLLLLPSIRCLFDRCCRYTDGAGDALSTNSRFLPYHVWALRLGFLH